MKLFNAGMGLVAAVMLVWITRPARCDTITSTTLTLQSFSAVTVQGNGTGGSEPRSFPFSLGTQPWLTAVFAPVASQPDEASLTLTSGNWPSPAPTPGTLSLTAWGFNLLSSVSITGITGGGAGYTGYNTGATMDSGGTFSIELLWSSGNFTAGKSQTFTITLNKPYAPSDFDQLSTPVVSPTYPSLFRAYSYAFIADPGNGEDYVADVAAPEPSRLVGLLSLAAIGFVGLCIGQSATRRLSANHDFAGCAIVR